MRQSGLPSDTATAAIWSLDVPSPPLTCGPPASDGRAPADSGAAASAELTRCLIEDHERVAQGMNDVVVRRVFAAGLDLQAALGLIGDHRGASKIWHAIDELDQAVRDIRETIFDRNRATHGPDANGTRG